MYLNESSVSALWHIRCPKHKKELLWIISPIHQLLIMIYRSFSKYTLTIIIICNHELIKTSGGILNSYHNGSTSFELIKYLWPFVNDHSEMSYVVDRSAISFVIAKIKICFNVILIWQQLDKFDIWWLWSREWPLLLLPYCNCKFSPAVWFYQLKILQNSTYLEYLLMALPCLDVSTFEKKTLSRNSWKNNPLHFF